MKHVAAFLILFCCVSVKAQEPKKPYDYASTKMLIHLVDQGGILYGPNRYSQKTFFNIIADIIIQYEPAMENYEAIGGIDLPLENTDTVLLINYEAEQKIIIGNHWISDGARLAQIPEKEYKQIKQVLDSRRKNAGENDPTDVPLAELVEHFQKQLQEERYISQKYEIASSKAASTNDKAIDKNLTTDKSVSEQSISSPSSTNSVASSLAAKAKVRSKPTSTSEDDRIFDKNETHKNNKKPEALNSTDEKINNSNYTLKITIAISLLLFLIYILRRKNK